MLHPVSCNRKHLVAVIIKVKEHTSHRAGTATRATNTFWRWLIWQESKHKCLMCIWKGSQNSLTFIALTSRCVCMCLFIHQVEAEHLMEETVPQLMVIDLIFQTQVSHQMHPLCFWKFKKKKKVFSLYLKMMMSFYEGFLFTNVCSFTKSL